jgi:Sigma-70 region 2
VSVRALSSAKARDLPSAIDPDIMRRLASGETGALGELYDRYQQRVRRFVALATSDAEDVDDLAKATFLAAGKSAGRYDGRDSCRPWLFGMPLSSFAAGVSASGPG